MGILLDQFRDVVSKNKDHRMKDESSMEVLYPTGFAPLDFINGCKIYVNDKNTNNSYYYYSLGITEGSACMLIGRSGCGKTTLAVQMAGNIVRNLPNAEIFHDDIEGGITKMRRMELTRMDADTLQKKYRYRNKGVTAENFYQTINLIKDIKLDKYDEMEYDTGYDDMDGTPLRRLPPTVYILDSIAMLMPEKYADEDELSGQMAATAGAKSNTAIFKRIVPMLKAANIILITINHITDAVSINPMQKKAASVSYLKPDEAIGGGKAVTYLSNNMFRLSDSTKLKEGEGLNIPGSIVDVQIIKSRSGKAGSVCSLVFNQDTGFDPNLSLYILLKNEKRINGAGAYLYIGDHSDKKFRQSEFNEKLYNDPEFYQIVMSEVKDILTSKVNDIPDFLDDIDSCNKRPNLSEGIYGSLGKIAIER